MGKLYESFYATCQDATPQQIIDTFHEQANHIRWMITSFSQQELFEPGQRQWASSPPSSWSVWK
ncbi:ClbS/DfsB family four-helix bundle protein [Bifidobacterium animalis]|uniref:ClbS/DfsB family four-helix bundle protein n=1 Tax=Bifidobacterium animalis TaxID=28025 RepID=UPI001EE9A1D3|nr:ClbS/DfsB family four-helix bundle protein [Bifidobacterium animalis]